MAKKLLIFTGSPREKSNSTLLARDAARGAMEAGASVEMINLASLRLNPCLACESCRKKGPGQCAQNDDMKKIYPKLKKASAIILAHPVYWFTINAQTKIFLDRWYAFGKDEYACFRGKKIGLILTYADKDVFSSGGVNALRAYQDIFGYLGAEIIGMVYATAEAPGEVEEQAQVRQQAYELGKEIGS